MWIKGNVRTEQQTGSFPLHSPQGAGRAGADTEGGSSPARALHRARGGGERCRESSAACRAFGWSRSFDPLYDQVANWDSA